jgi:glutamine synthetase
MARKRTTKPRSTSSVGRSGFIAKHGLFDPAQKREAKRILSEVEKRKLEYVRLVYCDQHGLTRGKLLPVAQFRDALINGLATTHALFAMDSANFIYLPVFHDDGGFGVEEMGGAGDMLMVPDPSSFRILPWAPDTGWVLCDLYLKSGAPMPFSPRALLRHQLQRLGSAGYELIVGLEIEFHVFKIDDPMLTMVASTQPPEPPKVSPLAHGYQYQGEQVLDELAVVMTMFHRQLQALQLPVRSLEDEWGPGQCEITLDPMSAMDAADAMVLLRNALKQVARREGYLVTFMCKPALPNVYSSGWHLHQSLRSRKGGDNAFVTRQRGAVISTVGKQYIAGLIEHAAAACAFSNPTINGYKRLNSNPLAPNRAVWSVDNKAACLRLVGGGSDPITHIENRSGEPAANPYLFIASQVAAGLDGLSNKRDPGPPLSDPYGQTEQPALPRSLMEAVVALSDSKVMRLAFGNTFTDYYLAGKQQEIHRFLSTVTEWEHREYFERF